MVVAFLANRAVLLLPSVVLLLNRSDASDGGGKFAGLETDLVSREARIVAASGRTPTAGWRVVLERSRAVRCGANGSVPVLAR